MYSTCIHCNRSLGANESIEHFPVGRRLAFDAARGRLWAVCRSCERWNLSPIEERWEAIEQCERAFRATKVRASTDNIGLARLRDGTEIVRVGAPLRPEFAAWRYGDQFGRRYRRSVVTVAATTVGIGAAVTGGLVLGASVVAVVPLIHIINLAGIVAATQHVGSQLLSLPDGSHIRPVGASRLVTHDDVPEGWGIAIGYAEHRAADAPAQSFWRRNGLMNDQKTAKGEIRLRGRDATNVLRWALPRVNRGGASRAVVADGVRLIERAGDPEHFGAWAVTQLPEWNARLAFGDNGELQYLPAPARLAFEMAMHEDTERRALDGELATLEAAWRNADEIARIADALLPSPAVDARLTAMHDAKSVDTTKDA